MNRYNINIKTSICSLLLLTTLINLPNYLFSQKKITNKKNDTVIVNKKVAVFYYPDDNSIRKAKKKYGNENFYTSADDNLYYMDLAKKFIKKKAIKIIEVETNKILKFIRKKHVAKIINLKKRNQMFGILLFDGNKAPEEIDMLNPEEEFKKYFIK